MFILTIFMLLCCSFFGSHIFRCIVLESLLLKEAMLCFHTLIRESLSTQCYSLIHKNLTNSGRPPTINLIKLPLTYKCTLVMINHIINMSILKQDITFCFSNRKSRGHSSGKSKPVYHVYRVTGEQKAPEKVSVATQAAQEVNWMDSLTSKDCKSLWV